MGNKAWEILAVYGEIDFIPFVFWRLDVDLF